MKIIDERETQKQQQQQQKKTQNKQRRKRATGCQEKLENNFKPINI